MEYTLPTHSQNECTLFLFYYVLFMPSGPLPNLQLTVCSLSHLKSVYQAKSVDHSIIHDSIALGFCDLSAGG